MKKLVLGILSIALFNLVFAGDRCGTMNHLQQQLQADPTLAARMQQIDTVLYEDLPKNGKKLFPSSFDRLCSQDQKLIEDILSCDLLCSASGL